MPDHDVLPRPHDETTVETLLHDAPIVALLGARNVGKATIARAIAARRKGPVAWYDLDDPRDAALLVDPTLALTPLSGLVVIDEVQRRPDLLPVLCAIADRRKGAVRFLVIANASLEQMGWSEADGVAVHRLGGLGLAEVGATNRARLWRRGGFPGAFLADNGRASRRWRDDLARTFLERDLPQLGVQLGGDTIRRFWTMLAHSHGQVWNASELARAFGVTDKTVRHYLDVLVATFMVKRLPAWRQDLPKRQVKAPKIYVADTGLLHTLLGIDGADDLLAHPKVGASFEGFAIGEIARHLGAADEECHFWALHAGATLDLLVVRGAKRRGFDVRHTDSPTATAAMRSAITNLQLDSLDVIHAGDRTFPLGEGIRAVAIDRLRQDLGGLRA